MRGMRIYYLERPLSPDDLAEVSGMLEVDVEQVKIPFVLPAPDERGAYPERPLIDMAAAAVPLQAAGICSDSGRRVGLVIPGEMHWYVGFSHAIHSLTGYYPYLVQTADHRESIGNRGSLRIIDMNGLMTG